MFVFKIILCWYCITITTYILIIERIEIKIHPCLYLNRANFVLIMNKTVVLVLGLCFIHLASSYLCPKESETRETKLLDGLWNFNILPQSDVKGLFENIVSNEDFQLGDPIKMPVPSSFNDVTTNKTIRDHVGWSWYQRSFYVPSKWLTSDVKVFVHFGSIHYWTLVYMNEVPLGVHEGGHLPFIIEVQKDALSSKSILTIFVNNTLTPDTIPQGAVTYPNDTSRYPKGYMLYTHAFDYFDYAGINRPVTLYTTPKVYISGINVTTDIKESTGIVSYNVTASNRSECVVKLYDKVDRLVADAVGCEGKLLVHNASFWWPAMICDKVPGYLYKLEVFLKSEEGDFDIYRQPVGIRKITLTNSSILVNNIPVYLRGFGMHEDADIRGRGFDYVTMTRDMNLIYWTGANAFRTSHYPYAEQTLDEADERGYLVILEAPACSLSNFNSTLLFSHHVEYLTEMIQVHKNRPSVIMWSLANEPVSNSDEANYYFGNLTQIVRKLDPTRPITFVTSQPVTEEKAVQHVDVICVNRYRGWYSDSGHTELIQYQVTSEMTAWHAKYGKPVILTEYGAGSIAGLHSLPETMWTEDYQSVTYLEHFKAFDDLRKKGVLAGEMVWNFIDFNTPQEYIRPGRCSKGLFTRQREPKQAAHTVRSRYLSLANCSARTL